MRRRRRILVGVLVAATTLLGACGDDDTDEADDAGEVVDDESTVDGSEGSDGDEDGDGSTDTDDLGDEDDIAADETLALCDAYDELLFEPTPASAGAVLAELEQPAPPGVEEELQAIVAGTSDDISSTRGYVGPVCGDVEPEEAAEDPEDFGGFEDAAAGDEGPASSTIESVCLALFDAWSAGDRAAASDLGDAGAIDELFAQAFDAPAGNPVRINDVGDCFYAVPSGVAEIVIADSDVQAFVVQVIWYPDDTFFDDPDNVARFESGN